MCSHIQFLEDPISTQKCEINQIIYCCRNMLKNLQGSELYSSNEKSTRLHLLLIRACKAASILYCSSHIFPFTEELSLNSSLSDENFKHFLRRQTFTGRLLCQGNDVNVQAALHAAGYIE